MPEHPSRDDSETTSTTTRRCPVCQVAFTPVRRQRYCTNACRQIAWRRRHTQPGTPVDLPPGQRRDHTVYRCPDCDTAYLGGQHCPDCNTFAVRVGPGGLCPHCDEPVALTELLDRR
jgi:hypothetical protein